ncbi:MAG: VanZ family protein [Candidatus Limnocylindrales bacterium]
MSRVGQVADFLGGYPGFLPGLAVSLVLAVFAARPLARALGSGRILAGTLVVSLGIVLSATLTPSPSGLARDIAGLGPLEHYRPTCDLSRIGPAPIGDYLTLNDTSLNVLLLVPLGLTIGLLPASRRKTMILLLALALPFVVEGTQLVVVPLDRACQSGDVSDNLLGLVFGLVAGMLVGRLGRRLDG